MLNEWLMEFRDRIRNRIECNDGFSLSVQASSFHYCTPRSWGVRYAQVEVGFPSAPVPEFSEYKDGNEEDSESVFGYVPVEIVEDVIRQHGGIKY